MFKKQTIDFFYDGCAFWVGHECPALFTLQLLPLIAKGWVGTDVFALLLGGAHSGLLALIDLFPFESAEKHAEIQHILVCRVVWIINPFGCYDFDAGIFEHVLNNALIELVAARQARDLHDEDNVIRAGFQIVQELLHLRPGGNRFAGNDFRINLLHGKMHLICGFQKPETVRFKDIAAAVLLGFEVIAGFT